ncbi:MAG: RluA family pseudouridine synthase [Lachnospiraceae bacterium]|nr:RluA family pseudouridine synthase [Lachnospiraceae bacterium]
MDSQVTEIANGVKILYEDNHIIVAIKPAGVLSQSDGSNAPDMLTIIKAYIKEKYQKPGEVYLGLVHRLDRPVSGVMVFARTSKAASRLSEQIRQRKVDKIYRCVVTGVLEGEGRLENFISKDEAKNIVTVSDTEKPGFKASYLDYKAIGTKDGLTLAEVKLGTGRSHQIRAQMAHSGHPLIGDQKYGKKDERTKDIALEAYKLSFEHPVKREFITFEAPIPSEFPWNLFA